MSHGLARIQRISGECLLMSSLPGKASRTLVELRGFSMSCLVNLISKDASLVFCLSVYKLVHSTN